MNIVKRTLLVDLDVLPVNHEPLQKGDLEAVPQSDRRPNI